MKSVQPLDAAQLRWKCDPEQFQFQTTSELDELQGLLGQTRAENAIQFGIGMQQDGYNLFVLGPSGSGKRTVIRNYLENNARDRPPPPDWCYVNNFEDLDRPARICLPAGMGRRLQKDVSQLVEDLQSAIPAALEADEHRRKIEQTEQQVSDEHETSLADLAELARQHGLEIIRTPTGVAVAPVREGQVISPDEFENLSDEKKKAIEDAVEHLQPKLQAIIQHLPGLRKLAHEKVKELNRDACRFAIQHLVAPLRKVYARFCEVIAHLDAVEADVVENADEFPAPGEVSSPFAAPASDPVFDQYLVNLLVDNAEMKGAPVIYEDFPHYHNLVGRIEHFSHMGSLVTDFSLIKAGAMHRANGGYLVVQARDVLTQPFAWDALKRTLRSGQIQLESPGSVFGLISTVSLRPQPIPLDIKVVLLGDRLLYYLLQQYDPEFDEHFKVAADFSDETDRTPENCQQYAKLLAALCKRENARPLDRQAVATMIEQAARHIADSEKLSTHMRSIADLLRESDYWANEDGAKVIRREHVHKAIDQQIHRVDRIREKVQDEIRRGTLLVDTVGTRVGQVNALSIISVGGFSFGRPARITATASMGQGKVVDIERESELGGAIHSKGVLILSSLLAARYAQDYPLSLSASLVFEQSYGMVEGDSASVAELCALLSVLANVPVQQGIAITGSLNQLGQSQPVGGVNEKIEGFFDVCHGKGGLSGQQAVLIPAANVKHLMLRAEVVEAAAEAKFSIFPYDSVDDAISLLTGVEAGGRDVEGQYPAGTVNFRVDQRLRELADSRRRFAAQKDEV